MADYRALFVRPETTVIVARDEHGRALAFVAVVVDDTVCLIRLALSTSHEARWALHDHLVRVLIARRVRYLLAVGDGPFGALGYPANVQHYQHLLGYELRHLLPVPPGELTRKRRRLASVSLATITALSLALPDVAVGSTPSAAVSAVHPALLRSPPLRADRAVTGAAGARAWTAGKVRAVRISFPSTHVRGRGVDLVQ
jgi:hypothetical protein